MTYIPFFRCPIVQVLQKFSLKSLGPFLRYFDFYTILAIFGMFLGVGNPLKSTFPKNEKTAWGYLRTLSPTKISAKSDHWFPRYPWLQTDRPTDRQTHDFLPKTHFFGIVKQGNVRKKQFWEVEIFCDYNTLSSQLRGPRESKNVCKAVRTALLTLQTAVADQQ